MTAYAGREAWKLGKGEVTATQATSHLLMEGSTRVGLAVVGGVVGQSIGLLLLGPAGALIVGGLLPMVAQGAARPLVNRIASAVGLGSKADEELDARREALCLEVEKAIDGKLSVLRAKHRQVGDGAAGTYVRHRLADEARHLDECQGRLFSLRNDDGRCPDRPIELLRVALRAVHPARYQAPLRSLLTR